MTEELIHEHIAAIIATLLPVLEQNIDNKEENTLQLFEYSLIQNELYGMDSTDLDHSFYSKDDDGYISEIFDHVINYKTQSNTFREKTNELIISLINDIYRPSSHYPKHCVILAVSIPKDKIPALAPIYDRCERELWSPDDIDRSEILPTAAKSLEVMLSDNSAQVQLKYII